MRQIKTALFVTALGVAALAQDSAAPRQLTQVPPKPSCNPDAMFHTTACEDLWAAYNAALKQRQQEELQLYINKQRTEAAAPLLQEVSAQQEQIKELRAELPEAHKDGMVEGGVYAGGGILLMLALVFGVRRFTSDFTVTKKSRAASA